MTLDKSAKDMFITELFKEYEELLYNTARARLAVQDDAKDAVGYVFYMAIIKADELYEHENKIAWLYRVLDNAIKKLKHINSVRRTVVGEVNDKVRKYNYIETVPMENLGIAAEASNFNINEWIDELRQFLTEEEICYVVGRFEYLFTAKELSDILGKSYSATTSFGNRTLHKVKKYFLGQRDRMT